MNLYKRIISLFLIFAICISSMVTVASAVDERTVPPGFTPADFATVASYGAAIDTSLGYLSGVDGYLGTLREAMTSGSCDGCPVNPDGRHNFMPVEILSASWAAVLRGSDAVVCRYCGITYNEFYSQTYNSYLDALQTDLGTTTLINGGVRAYLGLASSWNTITRCDDNGTVFTSNAIYYSLIGTSETSNCNVTIKTRHTPVPFACHVTTGVEVFGTYNDIEITGETYSNALMSAGSTVYLVPPNSVSGWGLVKMIVPGGVVSNGVLRAYADLIPVSGTLPTSLDITVYSRPASITGDYGIDVDGTIVRVEGDVIVDESTNTVYNPVTDTTYNFTDYAFDYSDRSYTLTLEDGTLLRVVYGDDNITIEEGDTIYIIYYLIPNIPDGDDSGSGDIPGGEDWSWWRKAWQEFTDKLFGILGNGSTVNPDNAPSVPDDEESGDKGYTIIDLFVVLKDGTWAFITGIVGTAFDGFTSFVDAVSSAGGFFTFFDEESQEGILFIPLEDGETIWD